MGLNPGYLLKSFLLYLLTYLLTFIILIYNLSEMNTPNKKPVAFNNSRYYRNSLEMNDESINVVTDANGNPVTQAIVSVTDASGMFEGSQAFQEVTTAWNWAALKNASSMFKNSTYKGYISPWFKSQKVLEDASNMFEGVVFSGNLISRIGWNMSTVKSTKEMFKNSDFTGGPYVNNWFAGSNVLEDASGMFEGATKFNRPIGNWDVTSLKDGSKMFKSSVFNQVIADWALDSAEDLDEMFSSNSAFNKWIGTWHEHISKVKSKENFAGSHGSFASPNFNKHKNTLDANISVDGLEVTIDVTLSDNLDFWSYQLNNGQEIPSNESSKVLILDPGSYNVTVHGYSTNLKGDALIDAFVSTFPWFASADRVGQPVAANGAIWTTTNEVLAFLTSGVLYNKLFDSNTNYVLPC